MTDSKRKHINRNALRENLALLALIHPPETRPTSRLERETKTLLDEYYIAGQIDLAQRILEPQREFMVAWMNVGTIVVVIKQVALCDNGPRSRAALQDAVSDLMKHLEDLNIVIQRINANAGKTGFYVHEPGLKKHLAPTQELRRRCEDFLAVGTDAALDTLRQWVAATTPELTPVLQIINELSQDPRGRPTKQDDWLTVECERLLEQGYTLEDAVQIIYDRLKSQPRLTRGEKKALKDITESLDPVAMIAKRLERKHKKTISKTK